MTAIQRQMIPDNSAGNLINLLLSEIRQSMVQEIRDSLIKEMRGYAVGNEEPLCAKEAAAFLKVSPKTLYKWIREGVIPAKCVHRKGSTPYFFPSELRDDLKKS
jgi:excisionase family DNA binding protein